MPTPEWWRGAVIYEIYPRSFQDTDDDGVGDLPGIEQRLEYVASLGVDGIWITPFYPSPMKDFGYDVADYCGVDPLFGTLGDFDDLLERAHELDLKVLVDQVLSHTSDQHAWFEESRQNRTNSKADWYVWADPRPDGTPPNNWLSVFGGVAWKWEPRRRQYYLHNFVREQPDLNVHNPEVQDALLDAVRFWLDRGVDGLRLDAFNFIMHDPELRDNPPAEEPARIEPYDMQQHRYDRSRPEALLFAERLRALLDDYPEKMTVAEIASDSPIERMVEYTHSPERLHTAYSFVFLGEQFGAAFISDALEAVLEGSEEAWPSWAFSNHDRARVVSRWFADDASPAKAKLFVALLTTLRGTAFLYQGEELGLPEADVPYERLRDPYGKAMWPENKGRDGCRTPMPWSGDAPHAGFSNAEPWLPVDRRHLSLAVDRQEMDEDSTLKFVRLFLRWRKEHPALVTGDIHFLDTPAPVLAFVREHAEETLLCAFNLSPGATKAHVPFDGSADVLDAGLPGTLSDGSVELPAWGGVFARLDG